MKNIMIIILVASSVCFGQSSKAGDLKADNNKAVQNPDARSKAKEVPTRFSENAISGTMGDTKISICKGSRNAISITNSGEAVFENGEAIIPHKLENGLKFDPNMPYEVLITPDDEDLVFWIAEVSSENTTIKCSDKTRKHRFSYEIKLYFDKDAIETLPKK